MKKIVLLFGFILLTFMLLSMDVSAQLFIEEGKIKKVVVPGQAVADSITIHNSTDQVLDVGVYLEDFEYVSPFDGMKKFYPAGTLTRSAANWVNFQPRQFRLQPYAKEKLNFTVNVPKDVSGGYYGVLFFERRDVQQVSGQVGIQVISRVGSLLFFETADRKKTITIHDLSFEKSNLMAKITNTGNIYLIAKCFYYVLNSDGIPVDRGELDPFYLSENNQTDILIPFAKDLSVGRYTAVLTFDLEDGVSFVHELVFKVDQSGIFYKQ
jgi:hypothetical protein